MSIGTIFTLFVVPMFYTFIAKDKRTAAKVSSPVLAHGSPAQPM